MVTDTPRTDAVYRSAPNMVHDPELETAYEKLVDLASDLERELAEANANAPWLSAAHALCSDMGVPQGHISERIEALRGVMEEARKDAGRYRWLRDDGADILAVCEGLDSVDVGSTRVAYTYEHQISGPYLDAAIDAEIGKETK